MVTELENLSTEELEKVLRERKANERAKKEQERVAYVSLRCELVNKFAAKALDIEALLSSSHSEWLEQLKSFKELMNQYGDLPKNSKGGFTITNEDATKKIRLKYHTLGDFDERAELAETHIRAFFEKTLKQTDLNTFDMMMSLLERKKGKLEYSRVMNILSFEERFEDEDWRLGCKLLKESWCETGSKYYIEIEVKNEQNVWRKVNLNISTL